MARTPTERPLHQLSRHYHSSAVRSAIKRAYNDEFKPLVQNSPLGSAGKVESLQSAANRISASEKMNEKLWPAVDAAGRGIAETKGGNFSENVSYMLQWAQKRIAWTTSWVNSL
jgi:hypothetical protein